MLIVLISWIIMLFFSSLFGKTIINIVEKKCKCDGLHTLDCYLVTGIIFLNVFAEYFSCMHKIGGGGYICLAIMAILCLIYNLWLTRVCKRYINKITPINICLLLLLIICVAVWTAGEPTFCDTYGYHAQAIRWIEEYGVVPGLGNLHNRFAYNSAFMVLQALFSFKWLMGQSLHTVNGFITIVFVGYAMLSFNFKNIWSTANLLKIATVAYGLMFRNLLSSPSSDTLALLLILWIDTKWSEFIEEKKDNTVFYVYLTIVSVYAITIKLSTVAGIVLALYPLIVLGKRKEWIKIGISTIVCTMVALPYLIRNVMISGYLLYPYVQLDIFDFDWEMSKTAARIDRMEITVWGRGVKDITRYNENIFQWFPTWWESITLFEKMLFGMGSIGLICLAIYIVYSISCRKVHLNLDVLIIANVMHFCLWFFGAPLTRYGIVYLMILPCIVLGLLPLNIRNSLVKASYYCVMFGYILLCFASYNNYRDIPLGMQSDYKKCEYKVEKLEDLDIYIAVSDGAIGYHVFPGILYENQLDIIELRGANLKSGFRLKERYLED